MAEIISKIPEQFKEFWDKLDKSNRKNLIIVSVIAFVLVITAIFFITRPQYQSLFSTRLDPKDVGDITAELERQNIEYKIVESGTAIEVKRQDFNKAKVLLAQAGYPKSGITFEDINKTRLGTTDAERRRNYQVYKESDLANALVENIENIKSARVMLSIPEQTKFFNQEENASKASVIIDSYESLNANQIRAIQKFISGSIENLDPNDVTILDSQGNMLNDESGDDINSNIDKQYELRQAVTKGVEKQVRDLLTGLADNVKVMANLDFDFSTMVTNKELYEPVIDEQGIIISREEKKETLTNGTAGGAAGTDTNPATYPNVTTGENGNYKLSDVKENFGVNRIISEESKEIGKINKETSSIAIAMFNNKKSADAGAEVESTDIDINKIKGIVSSATGIPDRNVTVEVLNIAASLPEPKSSSLNYAQIMGDVVPIVLVGALIGLIAFLMFRKRQEDSEVALPMGSIDYIVKDEDQETLPDIDLEEKSEVKKQIDKFVKQRPDAVAQLLRNWLSEDWD